MRDLTGGSDIEEALTRVSEVIETYGEAFAIVILGGAALNLLGVVARTTTDVDILAVARPGRSVGQREISEPPVPLPEPLLKAIGLVAEDMALTPDWLNTGPALQWRTGPALGPAQQDRVAAVRECARCRDRQPLRPDLLQAVRRGRRRWHRRRSLSGSHCARAHVRRVEGCRGLGARPGCIV